jgi:2-oxoglutarate ferredoxin oxidoreductase subunit delta
MKSPKKSPDVKASSHESTEIPDEKPNWTLYPAWCKRCGNCVTFCPTHALEPDAQGYPHLTNSTKCVSCHLCEKLCPDFAITVGEEPLSKKAQRSTTMPQDVLKETPVSPSPERLAHEPPAEEHEHNEK